ncbi:MAG: hypothetical protein COV31_02895 [Candidatus Yanofskybacteria bacterium CG10_big_fil_rev_8_21_14_0_10_46_23]|uniref:ABC transporter substrate-binding protein n=1 Tax=Candidatus Yanofskybacteria bacterium CG10_big_fil_rev_8_21_14_0_10_46_23 TaxID=1975098 RepID=A0A2H0R5H0_9BACT|nr:MAG: hypothetical protein COV31_02895 [Candidatus Yanofskybacteria bacterium CG10_big_fil_rev_8_21_14_0_10_46_23]
MGDKKLFIFGGLGLVAVLIILMVIILARGIGGGPGGSQQANLEFWGVFDDAGDFRQAIDLFQSQNPGIRVNYRNFSFEEYERQLINAFASGQGPDIFLMHHTWLTKHGDKIAPLPQNIPGQDRPLLTLKEFREQFVDVAEQDLVRDGQIYALPIYVDTLGLYYNKDIFNANGIAQPPLIWEELNEIVEKITQVNGQGEITQSAIALGTSRNVNRSTDILAMLMLQSGLILTEGPGQGTNFSATVGDQNVGEVALEYYTDFSNPRKKTYTWNGQQDFSIDAFREGKTAMMINYAHHVQTFQEQAPRFNFGTAPIPQISGSSSKITYANYWAPTVAKSSKNQIAAWQFLVSLSSRDGVTPYINASNRPPARRDLIAIVQNDPNIGVFSGQALTARSWYQPDPQAVESILAEVIDDVNFSRKSIREALRSAEQQINVLLF